MQQRLLLLCACLLLGTVGCSTLVPNSKPALLKSSTLPPIVVSEGETDRIAVPTPILLPAIVPERIGDPLTAVDVIAYLKRLGRPIGEVEEVSETEARFVDLRLASVSAPPEKRNGGSVEILPQPVTRPPHTSVDRVLNALAPPVPEHMLTRGRIVLRLSGRLSQGDAAAYAATLRRIEGTAPSAGAP